MIKSLFIAFFSLSFSEPKNPLPPAACQALYEGKLYEAQNLLNTIEEHDPLTPHLPLWRGYVELSTHHYPEAERFFQKAMKQELDEKGLQEAMLASALVAVCENKPTKLTQALIHAKKITQFSPHLLFFEGVEHYVAGEFAEALIQLQGYQEALKTANKLAWIDFVMERHFPSDKVSLLIAHALIEEGRLSQAHELLKEVHEEKAAPFLALCYLKEGERAQAAEKESYDKLASYYFASIHEVPSICREAMTSYIKQEALKRESPAPALITVLERWKAESALDSIADKVVTRHLKESTIAELAAYQKNSLFFALLGKKILVALKGKKEIGELQATWEKIEGTPFATATLEQQVSRFFETELVKNIHKDDERLLSTTHALRAFQEFEKDEERLGATGQELIHQGKLLWLKEGEEKKGSHLMKLALSLIPEEGIEGQKQGILNFFENLYGQAERSNLVKRLLLIHEALDLLAVRLGTPPTVSTIANYLADAEYLFTARQYTACQIHAELLLKLHSKNEGALRLYGLSSYHLGQYNRAMIALKKLAQPDEYAEKALMLCMAREEKEEKHLVQVDTLGELCENED